MSDTPRTDAEHDNLCNVHLGKTLTIYAAMVNFARALERENNQLRADLKQCAEALERAQRSYRIQYAINIGGLHNMETPYDKALSLPSVQNTLKDKQSK